VWSGRTLPPFRRNIWSAAGDCGGGSRLHPNVDTLFFYLTELLVAIWDFHSRGGAVDVSEKFVLLSNYTASHSRK
jgi:hypothetical protein